MKKLILAALMFSTACGKSSTDNEAVGQVKKVLKKTPLICDDYTEVDVSLGVVRNGVGSLSKEDVLLAIDNSEKDKIAVFKKAAEDGAIIKFTYDVNRLSLCWPDHRLQTVVVEALPSDMKRAEDTRSRPDVSATLADPTK